MDSGGQLSAVSHAISFGPLRAREVDFPTIDSRVCPDAGCLRIAMLAESTRFTVRSRFAATESEYVRQALGQV